MTEILSLNNLDLEEDNICTIGNFDGVHLGHQSIIRMVKREAKEKNLKSVVITFYPHPKKILSPQNYKCSIVNLPTKIYLLKKEDIDYVVVIDFNEHFYRKSAREFMDFLKGKIRCKKVLVGKDWRFGYQKEGDVELAKSYGKQIGLEVDSIPDVCSSGERISSTKIRKLLMEGDVKNVKSYLGRDYFLREKVVKGDQIGRKIGFPTINTKPDEDLCLKKGVYGGFLEMDGSIYPAVINYGSRPTVDGKKTFMEAHVIEESPLEVKENMFVNIHFVEFLREEKKFDDVEKLKTQIKMDIEKTREVLSGSV